MRVGIPKEIKIAENRVAITPAAVLQLKKQNCEVLIEHNAGVQSGFSNEAYEQAGAIIVGTAKEAWAADIILKVKEPIQSEYQYFREGLILFTYLHLAADQALTEALVKNRVTAIAYETVQLQDGSLPLLAPMSEIAGRMAAQIGAQFLEKTHGGKGVLMSGATGVERANVTIIGGGVVGFNAANIAIGLGANVTILDVNPNRLREIENIFGRQIQTIVSNPYTIAKQVEKSDLVIGAVLIPGAKAPKLVTEEMVRSMEKHSVIIDVAVDQGGIFETATKVTTHDNPIYEVHDVIHYAVGNMPGAVPKTSSQALVNVTTPYVIEIARKGALSAIRENPALAKGLNTHDGYITYDKVAEAHQLQFKSIEEMLSKTPTL